MRACVCVCDSTCVRACVFLFIYLNVCIVYVSICHVHVYVSSFAHAYLGMACVATCYTPVLACMSAYIRNPRVACVCNMIMLNFKTVI